MNAWTFLSVAILLVVGMIMTVVLAAGLFLVFHRSSSQRPATSTSIIVRTPTFIAGPSIEMALPAGSDLTSSSVDASGGNWWYQDTDNGHLQVLIAASKIGSGQPEVSNAYFQRVIRIVENSGGELVTGMSDIESITVTSYPGRRAAFDVEQTDGTRIHAVALLIRRESDDLLVVLYGDDAVRNQVDAAARTMFDSLHPRPTPQQYNMHSVRVVPTATSQRV